MRTLYLHIGLPKTGTTAIQIFCENNRELLKSQGYFYPESIYKFAHVELRRNGHFLVGVCKKENGERDKDKENELFEQGLDMVKNAFEQYDSIILSDENIWHGYIKRKRELWDLLKEHAKQNNYQIKIIMYLRRQDELALSWINQQIKDGWCNYSCVSWEYFLSHKKLIRLNYAKFIDKIAEVLGKDALCIRVFERGQFVGSQGNIFSDFLDAIGLTLDDNYVIEEEHSNTALTYNGQEIKRLVNSLPDADGSTHPFIREAAQQVLGTAFREETCDYLTAQERIEFLSEYEAGNQYIAREYLGRKDGKLFRDVNNKKEKWTPDNPEMYKDIIRFFGQTMLLQQKEIALLKKEQKQIKKEIEQLKAKVNNSLPRKIKRYAAKKLK